MGLPAAGHKLADERRSHTGHVPKEDERRVKAGVQRAQTRLKRARKTACRIWVADDARATHVHAGEKIVSVRADDEHDVFQARNIRGVDHVL